jgi:AcrR family transcriptional regulator
MIRPSETTPNPLQRDGSKGLPSLPPGWAVSLDLGMERGKIMETAAPRRRLAPAERRRQILDAAGALIAERGYRGVSIQDIADRVGLAKAGVRHHFPAKADVVIALLEDRDAQLLMLIQADGRDGLPRPSRDVLDAVVERNAAQREIITLFTVLEAEALDPEHPAHNYFVERTARARRLFRMATETLPNPEQAALELIAFLTGVELLWVRDPSVPYVALWRDYADRFFRYPSGARA